MKKKPLVAIMSLLLGVSYGVFANEDIGAEQRQMMADNPGSMWVDDGEDLWKKKRGPKNESLEKCDLGLGAGVLEGAYAQMPRYFADTKKVETLEGRLVTCMTTLQGLKEDDILMPHYKNMGEEDGTASELAALTIFVASKSNGKPFRVKTEHPEEKRIYELGKYTFYRRGASMDLSCASCHSTPGQLLRGVALPVMTDPKTAAHVMTAFPAYVLKDSNVRTWYWRNERCNLAMKFPWLKLGSELDAAMTLFQIIEASKTDQPISVPGVKPRA